MGVKSRKESKMTQVLMSGADVSDRKGEAKEAGLVEDDELYFRYVKLKETAEHPARNAHEAM